MSAMSAGNSTRPPESSSVSVAMNPVGWTGSPNLRGSLDILYSSFVVLFVSVWAVLHPNIPSTTDRYWRIVRSKALWAFVGVASPEILSLFAVSQWNAAKKSVVEMQEAGYTSWSIVHAFYANSGGFLLETPDMPPFPINAKSIHYLCTRGWISLPPSATRDDIWDRSKADVFAKGFSLFQAGWLLLQVIARAAQDLPVTPLELFTVAFIPPTLATAYFWSRKPQNVGTSTTIVTEFSIRDILHAAGEAGKEPWVDTPMDFIEKPCWDGWSRHPSLATFGGLVRRPIDRIPDDFVGPPNAMQSVIVWMVSVLHASVHVAGWSFAFPTYAEAIVWRASSLALLVFMVTGGLIPVLSTKSWFDYRFTLMFVWVRKLRTARPTWVQRNLLDIVSRIAYVIYILARLSICVEIFISFRAMPQSAYIAVNWSTFLPHVN